MPTTSKRRLLDDERSIMVDVVDHLYRLCLRLEARGAHADLVKYAKQGQAHCRLLWTKTQHGYHKFDTFLR